MNTLVIMRGIPGSGKSSCCLLGPKYGGDDYFMLTPNLYHFDQEQLGAAHRWTQWRVAAACQRGMSTIYADNTNTTWKEIKPYIEIAQEFCYKVVFKTPETSWAFDVDTCYLKNTHRVPKDVIQKMYDRFQTNAEIATFMKEQFPMVQFEFQGKEKP